MILTLGDSFTFGEELADQQLAWPFVLAKKAECGVVNLGLPGNSNPTMCRQLIEYFSHKHYERPSLVIVAWSSPGRMEFSDAAGNFNLWPGYSGTLFRQHEPWRVELLEYINRHHNDEWLFELFLHQIIFVQNFLQNQKIPYLMLNTVGNEYYKSLYISKFGHYQHLMDHTRFLGWPTQGMAEWTHGCTKGLMGHFLEEGHQRVADKIYEYIGNIGWLS